MAKLLTRIRRYERHRQFWRQVDVSGRDDCWTWRGRGDAAADLRAYQLVRGPLPPGTRLVHRCGNPRCVNPDHMDPARPG